MGPRGSRRASSPEACCLGTWLHVSKAGAGLGAVWEPGLQGTRGQNASSEPPGDRPGSDCRSGPRALIGHPAWLPTEIQENAISPSDMSRVREEAVLRSRHAELKDQLRGLSQGYERLRRVSHQGYGAAAGEPSGTRLPALSLSSGGRTLPFLLVVVP